MTDPGGAGGEQRLRALLIAPPGAGKGTQAERICAHFAISHISTGDVFRRAVSEGTKLGLQVKEFLDAGDLVPDEVVGEVVRQEVVKAMRDTGGYLLDGFPRTVPQAEAAHGLAVEQGTTAHAVLTFEVPRPILLERLMGRGSGRSDDNEATIRHRLDVYDRQTSPLLEYYEGRGVLVRVDADRPIDDVTVSSIEVLEQALASRAPL
ncbi:MAG: adenylate kinase [Acidimicrobiales bacterium]